MLRRGAEHTADDRGAGGWRSFVTFQRLSDAERAVADPPLSAFPPLPFKATLS
eukprot:gene10004-3495_t